MPHLVQVQARLLPARCCTEDANDRHPLDRGALELREAVIDALQWWRHVVVDGDEADDERRHQRRRNWADHCRIALPPTLSLLLLQPHHPGYILGRTLNAGSRFSQLAQTEESEDDSSLST